jgi:hypothetical protein
MINDIEDVMGTALAFFISSCAVLVLVAAFRVWVTIPW